MLRYQVSFQIEVQSDQQAISLRDGGRAWLEEQGAIVTDYNAAKLTLGFRVYGWDETAGARFEQEVQAADAEDAEAKVATATKHPTHVELAP